jgi:hypothetical protein
MLHKDYDSNRSVEYNVIKCEAKKLLEEILIRINLLYNIHFLSSSRAVNHRVNLEEKIRNRLFQNVPK